MIELDGVTVSAGDERLGLGWRYPGCMVVDLPKEFL